MRHYGGFQWTLEAYLHQVAAAFPWTWYAPPDYSCEPEVAACPVTVRFRQAATAALYRDCVRLAEGAGLPPPIPVLQGWRPGEYHRSWDLLLLLRPPSLLGIGSVCARHVAGPDGLMAVLHRVDRFVSAEVRLHLFGVKSEGIAAVLAEDGLDGRVASIDSMAWDYAARCRFRTGRTIERRAAVMREWHDAQADLCRRAAVSPQMALALLTGDVASLPAEEGDDALAEYLELVAAGEWDLQSALTHYAREDSSGPGRHAQAASTASSASRRLPGGGRHVRSRSRRRRRYRPLPSLCPDDWVR